MDFLRSRQSQSTCSIVIALSPLYCLYFFTVLIIHSVAPAAGGENSDEVEIHYSGNPEIITGDVVTPRADAVLFVFPSGSLRLTGDRNVILLKKGSSAVVTGDGNRVYLEVASSVELRGDGNQLFHQASSKIQEFGKNNTATSAGSFKLTVAKASKQTPKSAAEPTDVGVAPGASAIRSGVAEQMVSASPPPALPIRIPNGENMPSPDPLHPASAPEAVGEIEAVEAYRVIAKSHDSADQSSEAAVEALARLAPSASSLLDLLPSTTELKSGDLPEESSKNVGSTVLSSPVGDWKIREMKTSDALMNLVGITVAGHMRFFADGSGLLDSDFAIKEIDFSRLSVFTWSSDKTNLFVNQGLPSPSVWNWGEVEGDLSARAVTATPAEGPSVTIILERIGD